MELDELKSNWNSPITPKAANELAAMLRENRHPVLKRMRKQILIETGGWSAFLLCYYSLFDGAEKPLVANAILVIAVLAALLHNVAGYSFSKNLIAGGDLKDALYAYLKKMKLHATVSIILRVIFVAGLLTFFCWNVTIDSRRYVLLGAGLVLLIAQLAVLGNIWRGRIRSLRHSLESLTRA